MTSTLMTSVSLRQVIYIYNISVFLDVASTFMTFMFFRHDKMSSLKNTDVYKCRCYVKNTDVINVVVISEKH
jgi:hypothetical protein